MFDKKLILNTVEDSVGRLFYYDRKEDEDLPLGAIEQAINNDDITIEEIVSLFRSELEASVKRGGW